MVQTNSVRHMTNASPAWCSLNLLWFILTRYPAANLVQYFVSHVSCIIVEFRLEVLQSIDGHGWIAPSGPTSHSKESLDVGGPWHNRQGTGCVGVARVVVELIDSKQVSKTLDKVGPAWSGRQLCLLKFHPRLLSSTSLSKGNGETTTLWKHVRLFNHSFETPHVHVTGTASHPITFCNRCWQKTLFWILHHRRFVNLAFINLIWTA